MEIGILTYHRAYNYGAVLQCYALKEVLKRMGHDVYVIDYRQPDIETFYSFKSSFSRKVARNLPFFKLPIYIILSFLRDFKNIFVHMEFRRTFESFQKKRLNLTEKCSSCIPPTFDRYVIGSDMLWAYDLDSNKFDDFFLGDFIHKPNSRVIGYAISGTPQSFHRLGTERKFDFLTNFYKISIREKSLADIIVSYTGNNVKCCIDPTLLTTKDLWVDLISGKKREKKYIVTYFLRLKGEKKKLIKERIQKYSGDEGYDVININPSQSRFPISVEKYVSIISEAAYVITDSFHGVVFSLIFERPFHALSLCDSHDARYVDLLLKLGASEFVVNCDFTPSIPKIDYKVIANKINDYRADSLSFLRNNL